MKAYSCPHCGQSHFATLCSDCLAEEIPIQKTRSIFHIGRCHRCGHLDDEPCTAKVGKGRTVAQAWNHGGDALKNLSRKAARLATRAAGALRSGSAR